MYYQDMNAKAEQTAHNMREAKTAIYTCYANMDKETEADKKCSGPRKHIR